MRSARLLQLSLTISLTKSSCPLCSFAIKEARCVGWCTMSASVSSTRAERLAAIPSCKAQSFPDQPAGFEVKRNDVKLSRETGGLGGGVGQIFVDKKTAKFAAIILRQQRADCGLN